MQPVDTAPLRQAGGQASGETGDVWPEIVEQEL